ncbi:membrane protein DedA with SNARE-associated domain [Knoellia remsis]|uniref:Membrane protein DedA with SNARE-associated domain n=1 Tax=Knoellia remsis TaxID=407159 RepID=A0A2T0U691_9MICO|nr:VTT domain-containing protein [Knoellia remsis]PRY53388.1 membrane protein DedA with SNARE-associated domain [Knoellia remsis]
MTDLLGTLLDQPPWLILTVSALVVFGECALFVGMVLPGETVAVLAGAAAALGRTSLVWVVVVVLAAALIGDNVGYAVGRRYGPRLHSRVTQPARLARLAAAEEALVRRGGVAVVVGRWTPFVRSVMPSMAGMSGMPWSRFLLWDLLGAGSWSVVSVLAGYGAGKSYEKVVDWFGTVGAVLLGVVIVAGVAAWSWRRTASV